MATLPWVITSTIVSLAGGMLVSRFGYADIFMMIGAVFGCVGSGVFTTFHVETSQAKWIGYQIVYAVGSSLGSLTPMMVAQNALPLADIPLGTGMVMFFQIFGGWVLISQRIPSAIYARVTDVIRYIELYLFLSDSPSLQIIFTQAF